MAVGTTHIGQHNALSFQEKMKSGERSVMVTLAEEEMEYLSGHVIDGRNLFPAMGYLVSFTLLLILLICLKLRVGSRVQGLHLWGIVIHLDE
jgi:hypothetical protein